MAYTKETLKMDVELAKVAIRNIRRNFEDGTKTDMTETSALDELAASIKYLNDAHDSLLRVFPPIN